MKTIDEMLRDLKGRFGISASEIAEEMGINKAAISRLRSGTLSLSPDKNAQFHAIYARYLREGPQKPQRKTSTRPAVSARHAEILVMASEGKTYEEIGAALGISRQRVQQILAQHNAPPRQR